MRYCLVLPALLFCPVMVTGDPAPGSNEGPAGSPEAILMEAISRFVERPDTRVELEPRGHRSALGESAWSFQVFWPPESTAPVESGTAYYNLRVGRVSGITVATRLRQRAVVEMTEQPPEGAETTAAHVVAAHTPFAMDRLHRQSVGALANRAWSFTWEETTERLHVRSGARVGVVISAATGLPISYRAFFASRPLISEDDCISHEEALRSARAALGSGLTVNSPGTLYLSSPLAEYAPIWQFEVLREVERIDRLAVHAITGAPIRPGARTPAVGTDEE